MKKFIDLAEIYPQYIKEKTLIKSIYSNTNDLVDNSVFIALKGHLNDGHKYVKQAFEKGAKASIVEKKIPNINGKQILVKDTHLEFARLSYILSGFSNNFKTVAFTGTDGKTSSSSILFDLLNKLKIKAAYIGTNGIKYKNNFQDLECTTPLPNKLYPILKDMEKENIDILCLEASSHSLVNKRIDFINFDYAVFLNLSRDHLDFHKNMKHYKESKLHLFKKLTDTSIAILNIDDPYVDDFIKIVKDNNIKYFTFSLLNKNGDIYAYNIKTSIKETIFKINFLNNIYKIKTNLIGKYNVYNIIISILILKNLGFDIKDIIYNISLLKPVEGRYEILCCKKRIFNVVIDFAHAPKSIKNILKEIKKFNPSKIITVTGAVGDGDKGKRSEMAQNAIKYSDEVIFTTDQPYSEDPKDIINEMLKDIDYTNNFYKVIINREEAIKYALDNAKENNIILVLGKGRENKIKYKDKVIEFNDFNYVKNYIEKV